MAAAQMGAGPAHEAACCHLSLFALQPLLFAKCLSSIGGEQSADVREETQLRMKAVLFLCCLLLPLSSSTAYQSRSADCSISLLISSESFSFSLSKSRGHEFGMKALRIAFKHSTEREMRIEGMLDFTEGAQFLYF